MRVRRGGDLWSFRGVSNGSGLLAGPMTGSETNYDAQRNCASEKPEIPGLVLSAKLNFNLSLRTIPE
jgi:hypothetical protein